MSSRVEVVPYDQAWPQRFRELATALRNALGDNASRIDHIGSTAIPGLDAKPIIDLQISVGDFDPRDAYRLPLERLGYVFRSDNPELTKRYFREPPGQQRTHVHVRRLGSWSEQFALLFRDYLRSDPKAAQHYGSIKHALAVEYHVDRKAYMEAKEPYLWTLMRRADRWSQDTGWHPGLPDA